MSSSPIKKYDVFEIIKNHLLKLKDLKDRGIIKNHELAQMEKLQFELVELEHKEK